MTNRQLLVSSLQIEEVAVPLSRCHHKNDLPAGWSVLACDGMSLIESTVCKGVSMCRTPCLVSNQKEKLDCWHQVAKQVLACVWRAGPIGAGESA